MIITYYLIYLLYSSIFIYTLDSSSCVIGDKCLSMVCERMQVKKITATQNRHIISTHTATLKLTDREKTTFVFILHYY